MARLTLVRVLLACAVATCAMLAAHPAPVRADGDPASDVLLGQDVFYPYSPPVPRALAQQLNGAAAAARRLRSPVKIALIAQPTDLGVIPSLFDKPQEYANFLDQEISFTSRQ